jgi:UDP-N-acetylmuramate dehydrogenase
MFTPRTPDDLARAAAWTYSNGAGFFILGGGSNALISDDALETPVILTTGMSGITVRERLGAVYLDCLSGTLMKDVLAFAAKNGWSGLECAAGIPGTVGGAVAGNAGCGPGSVGSSVERVVATERDGSSSERGGGEITWGYRNCSMFADGGRIAQCVTFKMKKSSREEVARLTAETTRKRKDQPLRSRTAGCVFKNPSGASAGRLLDESGCKGMSVGGASVSDAHANFIENRGGTARDILSLALLCRKKTLERFGVALDFEIKTMGFGEVCHDVLT